MQIKDDTVIREEVIREAMHELALIFTTYFMRVGGRYFNFSTYRSKTNPVNN